jgi:3-phosphoshikimate 1-carboxyvinyltransferase
VSVRTVRPGVIAGTVAAPPSKSYTHRALVAGHLAARRYEVIAPLDADDTRATARAIRALGTTVHFARSRWSLSPGRQGRAAAARIDCGESGTTLRFAAALAAREDRAVTLSGGGRLPLRPVEELLRALEGLGGKVRRPSGMRNLPATVHGPVRGGTVRLDASISSQFVSALLLVLPTVPGDSRLELLRPIVSEPYIEATLAVLRHHGIRVDRRGRVFSIRGAQRFRGHQMRVPGDASSAAYLWTAAALTGGRVRVRGLPREWPQADLAILNILRNAGAKVHETRDGATVEGSLRDRFAADLTASPDLYPLAGVVAATVPGTSELRGADHVVLKESDRRAATIALVRAMGAEARRTVHGLAIRGTTRPRALRVRDLSDHRLVMSAGVGALVGPRPSIVGDASAVSKSFPEYWATLSALREGGAP